MSEVEEILLYIPLSYVLSDVTICIFHRQLFLY